MLQVLTTTPETWSTIVRTASSIIEEVNFEFHPDMASMRSMDPSHIALVNLEWVAPSFEKYICDSENILSIRLADLDRIIKRADANDKVELSLGEERTLVIKLFDGYKREFSIHLLDSQYTSVPLPKVTYSAKVIMPLKSLRNVLDDISAVSEQVNIKLDKSGASFAGSSESGKASASIAAGSGDIKDMSVKDAVSATYSVEYLNKFLKSLNPAKEISLEFGNKMPIKLEVQLDEKGSKLQYYLAPRVD